MAKDPGDTFSKKLGMTPNQWKKMIEELKKKPPGWGTGMGIHMKVKK